MDFIKIVPEQVAITEGGEATFEVVGYLSKSLAPTDFVDCTVTWHLNDLILFDSKGIPLPSNRSYDFTGEFKSREVKAKLFNDKITITFGDIPPGSYLLTAKVAVKNPKTAFETSATVVIQPNVTKLVEEHLPASSQGLRISLQRSTEKWTDNLILMYIIKHQADRISFKSLNNYLAPDRDNPNNICDKLDIYRGVDGYQKLKVLVNQFLQEMIVTQIDLAALTDIIKAQGPATDTEIDDAVKIYFKDGQLNVPYLARVGSELADTQSCDKAFKNRLHSPIFLELIWSYFHEEGMLSQCFNAISLRFQNKFMPGNKDPLAQLAIDPLRPLSNILWGHIQDEINRLTVVRRAYEYHQQYGLTLIGKATANVQPVETRSKFLEAFHNLLSCCAAFYKELDDTTVHPDAFPLLNSLREVHLILAEGANNQFGDLPWTARVEMLTQQWILARPEMRDFLASRVMVPYQEDWMGRVDSMKKLQNWTDVTVTHFHNLAVWGEQILLSIRYGNWNDTDFTSANAGNWASFWRDQIQGYIHAYRAATGVDITIEPVNAELPGILLQRRLAMQGARI